MINHKLTYLLPIALTIIMAACTETYPGITEDMSGDDVVEREGMNDTIMANEEFKLVSVAISDPSYSTITADTSATRGFGGFDLSRPEEQRRQMWDNARFYLYAFRDTTLIDFSKTRKNDSVACLLDNEPTWMADPNGNILSYVIDEEHDGHRWWNNKLSEVPYRFWGYFTDDVNITHRERTSHHISMDFEIDGSQDILSGTAELTKNQHEKVSQDPVLQSLYEQYASRETPWQNLFSTTSARHDILPIIKLRHNLPRFKFQIYPGNEDSDGMVIDNLQVYACTQGRLVVAANDNNDLGCTFDKSSAKWLDLHDKDNSPTLLPDTYINHWKAEYSNMRLYDRDFIDLGEGIMVPAADSLRIKLVARQPKLDDETGEPVLNEETGEPEYIDPFAEMNISNVVTLRYQAGFKPGYQYTIRVALYGDKPYSMNAILSGWEERGSVVINPEEDDFRPY